MSVGKRIKALRKELGLSVDEVADKLGKNRATIYRYESDDIENLPITVMEPLAKILGTTPSYLMGWNDLEEMLSKSEQETNFFTALKLIGCDVEYKEWLIAPRNFELDENQYYAITYDDTSFNITVNEYEGLVKDIKSYLRFKILGLKEKRKEEALEQNTLGHLLPDAAHEIEGATEEDKAHDDEIMDGDDF